MRDTIASLRTELGAIKSSVDTSNRNANAQFAKFNERLERIDRAQAAPAAQLKQAMEAIDRLEKRVQAQVGEHRPDRCGRSRPRPSPPAAAAAAESARARVIDGWMVRNVNRNVAVIQGRRRARSKSKPATSCPASAASSRSASQEGRWVVVTSKG